MSLCMVLHFWTSKGVSSWVLLWSRSTQRRLFLSILRLTPPSCLYSAHTYSIPRFFALYSTLSACHVCPDFPAPYPVYPAPYCLPCALFCRRRALFCPFHPLMSLFRALFCLSHAVNFATYFIFPYSALNSVQSPPLCLYRTHLHRTPSTSNSVYIYLHRLHPTLSTSTSPTSNCLHLHRLHPTLSSSTSSTSNSVYIYIAYI